MEDHNLTRWNTTEDHKTLTLPVYSAQLLLSFKFNVKHEVLKICLMQYLKKTSIWNLKWINKSSVKLTYIQIVSNALYFMERHFLY